MRRKMNHEDDPYELIEHMPLAALLSLLNARDDVRRMVAARALETPVAPPPSPATAPTMRTMLAA